MPKPTFHNLPEAKQARIMDAAAAEFAAYPFEAASVNRIVRAAGIAKGSFYQYFNDMVDLYRHLMIGVGGQGKMAAFKANPPSPDLGLFGQLEHSAGVAIRWAMSEPLLSAASRRLREPLMADSPLKPFQDEMRALQIAGMSQMLAAGQASGAVRPELNPDDAAVFVVLMMQEGTNNLLQQRTGVDMITLCSRPDLAKSVDEATLNDVVHTVTDMIQRSVGADPSTGALDFSAWSDLVDGASE